jgi:hypothetical protein
MKPDCATAPLPSAFLPESTFSRSRLFGSLERIIDTAGFVSVDLTETVFVSLHEQRDRAPDAPPRLNCSE